MLSGCRRSHGEVPERSNGAVSKTVVLLAGGPRVRIPPSPPNLRHGTLSYPCLSSGSPVAAASDGVIPNRSARDGRRLWPNVCHVSAVARRAPRPARHKWRRRPSDCSVKPKCAAKENHAGIAGAGSPPGRQEPRGRAHRRFRRSWRSVGSPARLQHRANEGRGAFDEERTTDLPRLSRPACGAELQGRLRRRRRSRPIALGANCLRRRHGWSSFRAAVQPRPQLVKRRPFRHLSQFAKEIVRQRHAGQCRARFEPAM